jgi:outer membrane lipoprotein carrier protein
MRYLIYGKSLASFTKIVVFKLFFALLLLSPQDLYAEQSALDKLVERLAPVSDIQGDFIQFVVDARGTRVQETKGRFKAMRPDFFYWATTEPLEQEIFVADDMVTVYDPDLEQATIQAMNEDFSATPSILFNGNAEELSQVFNVEHRSLEAGEDQFLLYPKQKESLFELLRVRFKGGRISDMRISDSLGQDTTVSFIQTQINTGLSAEAFQPELPEDTDIIRQ